MRKYDKFGSGDYIVMATLAHMGIQPVRSTGLSPDDHALVNALMFWLATDRDKGRIKRIKAVREALRCELVIAKEAMDSFDECYPDLVNDLIWFVWDHLDSHKPDLVWQAMSFVTDGGRRKP